MQSITRVKQSSIIMALLIISVIMLQGCVVFLSTVATVVSLRSSNNFVSTVLMNKDPVSVHDALLVVVESTPEMELVSVQKEMNLINATLAGSPSTIKVTPYGSRYTHLIISVDTEGGDGHVEDLALDVIRRTGEKLGVNYKMPKE